MGIGHAPLNRLTKPISAFLQAPLMKKTDVNSAWCPVVIHVTYGEGHQVSLKGAESRLSYFPVAMIKYHDQHNLEKEGFACLSLWIQRD